MIYHQKWNISHSILEDSNIEGHPEKNLINDRIYIEALYDREKMDILSQEEKKNFSSYY